MSMAVVETPTQNWLNRRIISFFYLSVFFPYFKLVPGVDTQPVALILAICIFFVARPKKVPVLLFLLVIPFATAFMMLVLSNMDFSAFRNFLSYISLFLISISTYFALKSRGGFEGKYLSFAVWVLFIVGFIQSFIYKGFLNFLLPRAMSSFSRGAIGLAPEPSQYGCMCLFLMIFCHFHKPKHDLLLKIILLIQIVVFARSSMIVLFLGILFVLYSIFFLSIRNLFLGVMGVTSLFFLLSQFLHNTRLYQILNILLQNPMLLVLKDGSGNERFFHIFFSMLGFFRHYGMPGGFSSWKNFMGQASIEFHDLVWWLPVWNKILSGYGAAFYELGIFAIIIPIVLIRLLYINYQKTLREFWVLAIFLTLILFSAIPLSFPYIGFMFGYLAYYGYVEKKQGYKT